MNYRWNLQPTPAAEKVDSLCAAININPVTASILINRGIDDFEAAKHFYRPRLGDLHDPFLMQDMHKAVDRLLLAIQNNEKILLFGDYDVDGTTAVSLVYDFLHEHYSRIDFYIPDRFKEGYGISKQGIEYARAEGFSLIISLDCGIKSTELIAYALELGIDFIVCDHHTPGDVLPPAAAVLDPKRSDCAYPYKELSGAGVGFKLMQAFCITKDINTDSLYRHLDLAAVSIACDIVALTGENRVMAFYGLLQLNENPRPGLAALAEIAGLKKKLTITDLVFGIGPRINAAGRLEHARQSVELLLEKDAEKAGYMAAGINKNNNNRKDFDRSMTQEALEMIRSDENLLNAKSTVLYAEHWHKGVVGIVASRCIEQFYRPTVILTHSEGKAVGSARSVPGFDLYEAICECADVLGQFGGHTHAAGMTLDPENVELFREKFEKAVTRKITDELLIPKIDIDAEVTLDRLNEKFYLLQEQMGPFGPGNMQPVYVARGLKLHGEPRILKEEHLKICVASPGSYPVDAIGFGMAPMVDVLKKSKHFDLCFTLDINEFRGERRIQLMIKDIKPTEPATAPASLNS